MKGKGRAGSGEGEDGGMGECGLVEGWGGRRVGRGRLKGIGMGDDGGKGECGGMGEDGAGKEMLRSRGTESGSV